MNSKKTIKKSRQKMRKQTQVGGVLTLEQIRGFTPQQISELTREQILSLTKEQIEALTPEQIKSIQFINSIFRRLTDTQKQHLLPQQISNIMPAIIIGQNLEFLNTNPELMNSLTEAQIGLLNSNQIFSLNIDILNNDSPVKRQILHRRSEIERERVERERIERERTERESIARQEKFKGIMCNLKYIPIDELNKSLYQSIIFTDEQSSGNYELINNENVRISYKNLVSEIYDKFHTTKINCNNPISVQLQLNEEFMKDIPVISILNELDKGINIFITIQGTKAANVGGVSKQFYLHLGRQLQSLYMFSAIDTESRIRYQKFIKSKSNLEDFNKILLKNVNYVKLIKIREKELILEQNKLRKLKRRFSSLSRKASNSNKKKLTRRKSFHNKPTFNISPVERDIKEIDKKIEKLKLELLGEDYKLLTTLDLNLFDTTPQNIDPDLLKDDKDIDSIAKILAHCSTYASKNKERHERTLGISFSMFIMLILLGYQFKEDIDSYKNVDLDMDVQQPSLIEFLKYINVNYIIEDEDIPDIPDIPDDINKIILNIIGRLLVTVENADPAKFSNYISYYLDFDVSGESPLTVLLNILNDNLYRYELPNLHDGAHIKENLEDIIIRLEKLYKLSEKYLEYLANVNVIPDIQKYGYLTYINLLNVDSMINVDTLKSRLVYKTENTNVALESLQNMKTLFESYIDSIRDDQKKLGKLLRTITSSNIIPERITVQINFQRNNEYRAPITHTCFNTIEICEITDSTTALTTNNKIKTKAELFFESMEYLLADETFSFAG